MIDESDRENKICSACGQLKPLEQFRRRYAGTERRHSQCNECAAEYARQLRADAGYRQLCQFTGKFHHRRFRPKTLEPMATAIVAKHGDLSRFVERMYNAVEAAEQSKRPHAATRFYLMLVEAMRAAWEQRKRRERRRRSGMSTRDLADYQRRMKEARSWEPPPM